MGEAPMRMKSAALGCLLAVVSASSSAWAQGTTLPAEREVGLPARPGLALLAEEHTGARLEYGRGWVVLGLGLGSLAAGGGVAGGLGGTELGLAAGATTMAWGGVHLGFAVPMVALAAAHRGRLAATVAPLDRRALARRREEALEGAHTSVAIYAVNAGLDVAYLVAGGLLYGLASNAQPRGDVLRGVGLATLVQGGLLLAFDLSGWIQFAQHAGRLRAVDPYGDLNVARRALRPAREWW